MSRTQVEGDASKRQIQAQVANKSLIPLVEAPAQRDKTVRDPPAHQQEGVSAKPVHNVWHKAQEVSTGATEVVDNSKKVGGEN